MKCYEADLLPPMDAVDDILHIFYCVFTDCNGFENVLSFSNNPKTRPIIVYNKNLCKIRTTSAKSKTKQKKTTVFFHSHGAGGRPFLHFHPFL